jgi:hypothetical protein
MRCVLICGILLATAEISAGRQAVVPPNTSVGDTSFNRAQSGVRLGGPLRDSTELALIEQLKALVPDSSTLASLEKSFASASVVGMHIPNPAAQAIADRIFARRKAYADSVVASWPKSPHIPTISATVVLVESLSDSSASAEILRRPDVEPHDVILIPSARATLGAVEMAIHTLVDLWTADGHDVPSKSQDVTVHGEMHIRSWTQFNESVMTSQLMSAAQAPTSEIAGIGSVRSFTIAVAHRPPVRPNDR